MDGHRQGCCGVELPDETLLVSTTNIKWCCSKLKCSFFKQVVPVTAAIDRMNTLPPLWNFQTKHWQKVRGYPRRSTTNDQKAESKEQLVWHVRLDLEVSVEVWRFCRVSVFFPLCFKRFVGPWISSCPDAGCLYSKLTSPALEASGVLAGDHRSHCRHAGRGDGQLSLDMWFSMCQWYLPMRKICGPGDWIETGDAGTVRISAVVVSDWLENRLL